MFIDSSASLRPLGNASMYVLAGFDGISRPGLAVDQLGTARRLCPPYGGGVGLKRIPNTRATEHHRRRAGTTSYAENDRLGPAHCRPHAVPAT